MKDEKERMTQRKRSPMARFLRFVCWLLVSPIILFVVLTALLYVPFIQDWATGIACEKLSEASGKDVKVERLRLKFPLDVDLQGVCITEPVPGDTLLAVKSCVVDLDLCQLFSGRVGVDALDLSDVIVDSHDVIATLKLRGRLKDFHLDAHNLELKESKVNITAARLHDCDLDIALQDTTVIDTTTSQPLLWKLNFSNIELKNTRVAFHTANDTMSVKAGVKAMTLQSGTFNLGTSMLALSKFELEADSVLYDMNYEPHQQGLDYNHLALHDVGTSLPWLDFDLNNTHLRTSLSSLTFSEQGSGLQLDEMSADVDLDTTRLKLDNAVLKTPTSKFTAWADMEWASLTPDYRGHLDAGVSAQFSREDVLRLAGAYLPAELRTHYPDKTLTAEVEVAGNLDHVDVKAFRVMCPGMIDATVSGSAGNLMNGDGTLSADLEWDIHTQDLTLVKRIAHLTGFNLPAMDINGTTHIADDQCSADVQIRQGRGTAKIKGRYNLRNNAYQADLRLNNLKVSNFVPMDSVCVLSVHANVRGNGFDPFSPRTNLRAELRVDDARYGRINVGDLDVDCQLKQGVAQVNFFGDGDVFDADGCLEFTLQHNKVDSANFAVDVRGLDLYALGITKKPFKASMAMHMLGNSNLSDEHYAKGTINSMLFELSDTIFYPRDIRMETLLTPDTTYAFLSAGDLLFHLNSTDGVQTIIDKGLTLVDSISSQMDSRQYNQRELMRLMPNADLCIQSGQLNPLAKILNKMTNFSYRELDIDLHTDSLNGVRGDGHVYAVNTGSVVLDTIMFDLHQGGDGINLDARMCNGKKNKDVTFDAKLNALINPDKVGFSLLFFDDHKRKGVDLGAELAFSHGDMRLHLTPLHPILAYRHFTVNEDNFLELQKGGRVDANLDLIADDGTGLKLYSTPNEEAEQDITASLNHFNVGEICGVLPYMPNITGMLHGDVHYVQSETQTSVMADLVVNSMAYDNVPLGDIGLNAAYMPNEDGSHYVDGFMTQDDNQVLSFNGLYSNEGKEDNIDAGVTLEQFPVSMANAFLDESVQLAGYLLGDLKVNGSTSAPKVNGTIRNESLHIMSPMYSINLNMDDDSISVKDSRLSLDRLTGHTLGSSPLTLDGVIDFHQLSNVSLNLDVRAKNFELINAKKSRKVSAYGKVYVDVDAHVKGDVNNLRVYGDLSVLGNTNVTYVLKDSPITVEDEMSDLVEFCDFSDTLEVEQEEYIPPSNLSMNFNIHIDQTAMVNCLLSEDAVNFVRLEGGGDLRMTYDEPHGIQMYGRYNIIEGQMTYSLMVVTLKNCFIQNGSYVEFTGDISNPRLNIEAKERVNSSITENDVPRTVAFDVGMKVTQTLSNMGLEFTLDAPEDLSMKTTIAQMTPEQRGRVAVTLMTTGMYLVEGGDNSGGMNATNALNAFLQSQISNITGKALGTIDLSLGVSTGKTLSGATTTDYSYRFAKRFWGNRISLVVGGTVTTNNEAMEEGKTFIDNVSIEYRLDKSATRYVSLFYNGNVESVIEGRVMQMGVGLVLRKKTDYLGELFVFRRKNKENKESKKSKENQETSRVESKRKENKE